MRRRASFVLLLTLATAAFPLVACEDNTTINPLPVDAGTDAKANDAASDAADAGSQDAAQESDADAGDAGTDADAG